MKVTVYIFSNSSSGVRVFFDNDQSVYVAVPERFIGEMCGLCGNYDRLKDNDFIVYNKVSDAERLATYQCSLLIF